jgi:hypothetical protein
MKEKIFKSVDEIKMFYRPKAYERARLAKMTPSEFGEYLAQDVLDKIKRLLG